MKATMDKIGINTLKKFVFIVIPLTLIILVAFQISTINQFFTEKRFYSQHTSIIVKQNSENMILEQGDSGYVEISQQVINMIFSPDGTLLVTVVSDFDTYAGNRSYVRIDTDSLFKGKQRYFIMLDSSDPYRGGIYWCNLNLSEECTSFSAYVIQDPDDFRILGQMLNTFT